jgi:hypothetical protein
VSGEPGTTLEIDVLLPTDAQVTNVVANGHSEPSRQEGSVVTLQLHFEGMSFSHMQQVGTFDPNFVGGTVKGASAPSKTESLADIVDRGRSQDDLACSATLARVGSDRRAERPDARPYGALGRIFIPDAITRLN